MNREISQLWWVAEKYFTLAKGFKDKLECQGKCLQTTVTELSKKCECYKDIKKSIEHLMLLNAHLASCAIRLYSIDEKRKGCSMRWAKYQNLKGNEQLKKPDVKSNIGEIVHLLLRHNVAHEEDLEKENKKYKQQYKKMQKVLHSLTIEALYENMKVVKDEIEKDIKKVIEES
jgi:hypothetical protein